MLKQRHLTFVCVIKFCCLKYTVTSVRGVPVCEHLFFSEIEPGNSLVDLRDFFKNLFGI